MWHYDAVTFVSVSFSLNAYNLPQNSHTVNAATSAINAKDKTESTMVIANPKNEQAS
ncbi:MAG: hypothetical protein IJK81_02385 [Selenomonadaceae bacterium]|nr:hypothetical protein [Selenomonadaceae bacterium]